MSPVVDPDESAIVKDLIQLNVPYGNWLLSKLKVGLYQISKVRESFLRESCEVFQQSFGKPIEEFSDLNWPFEDLIQASGVGFEALWNDADVDTDANGQVHIIALLHNAWQDTTNLLSI